ncbi:MAG: metallophosphoesterase family protein [Theionarchaea archaeon]|nr:metallophosphoesterase family protein [Theionarchaea archaeon]MBU6999338.1 metallophosphoesterase family protein [Theionarchaea archaeon]MBU7021797.1 metallophosphoesterase family protein [Theionarchaea archaeon]MBU7034128.1 metallophosphoesterase family protein [Theionarchaea archaeon]MBU7040035.1 metallophosphoesterase family protein [Theionarchaea archaeon]
MNLCVIADLHGTTTYISRLQSVSYDLLVICGDITHFGHAGRARSILSTFPAPYLAVHGNCDYEDVVDVLEEEGCNLHEKTVRRNNETLCGLGGANYFRGKTPSEVTEQEIYDALSHVEGGSILVTHVPPHNTAVDRAFRIKHAGSTALRQVVEEKHPALLLCGHIHEGRGHDVIGDTLVVNPGEFSRGYYALVSTEDRTLKMCRF